MKQQEAFEHDAHLAEDEMDRITNIKADLMEVFLYIHRYAKSNPTVSVEAVKEAEGIMLEQFEELFSAEWKRLWNISRSSGYAFTIDGVRVPTNPQTYEDKGEPW